MPERTFKIIAYVDRVPSMGCCTNCQHKFFIPRDMFRRDNAGAEQYLLEKFIEHKCGKPSDIHRFSP